MRAQDDAICASLSAREREHLGETLDKLAKTNGLTGNLIPTGKLESASARASRGTK